MIILSTITNWIVTFLSNEKPDCQIAVIILILNSIRLKYAAMSI